MGSRANRMNDRERLNIVAWIVGVPVEQLEGFVLVAVTHNEPCNHRHIRATRAGTLSKSDELIAIDQAVGMLYD